MKYSKIYFFLIYLFFISIESKIFDPTTFQSLNRLSSAVLSPDGKYVVYSIRKWDKEQGKSATYIQCTNIDDKKTQNITNAEFGKSDSSPSFSPLYQNLLFFLREGSLYYISFPPKENEEPVKLTNYPVDINDFKIKASAFVFSANVYFDCKTLECSAKKIEIEKKQTYQVYNKLFMFHWDTWQVEGKGSHLFYQKIKVSENKVTLDGNVTDITEGMEINTPPLFTDNSNYDISNNGQMIAFSAHNRNQNESWNTGYQTYFIDLNLMNKPILITKHNSARTQHPVFSIDDTRIAYLAMNTPGLESEFLHFEIYNILTNKITILPDILDKFIITFEWFSDTKIYFQATSIQVNRIFTLDITNTTNPIIEPIEVDSDITSYSLPHLASKNRNIALVSKVSFFYPYTISTLKINNKHKETELIDPNKSILKDCELTKPTPFNFTGALNDTVYGWILKPINFNPSKKYPVVLLIHGGPESSWTSGWSYSWVPQSFTNQGYVTIMINPHGSNGFSQKFQSAVRDNWGGAPYEDIIKGIEYVNKTFNFSNVDKMCAAGGSYGGFMINWIEGNSKLFKCLINHDGIFSSLGMFYSTEEIWFPKEEFCSVDNIGCNPWEGENVRKGFFKYSPESFVKNWSTPMLVIHGGRDYRVPLTEGLSTFTSLQLKNVDSEFLFFHQENHWVLKPENQVIWLERAFKWLNKYIGESKE